jgi:hypothetical protein
MTMTEGTAPKPPSAFPVDLNPSHPMYGFETDKWVDQPIPKGPDWFSLQERYRRNANANGYKQHGNPTNWNRYITLGLFVFDDCIDCDKAWSKMEEEPIMIHRAIWYNFMCHVDRELQVPDKLNAWATNISQPYLAHYDPTTLHETDTIGFLWKEMHFMKENMDTADDPIEWIPVKGRRRSKSPPNQNDLTEMKSSKEETGVSLAPGFNPPPEDLPSNYRSVKPSNNNNKRNQETIRNSNRQQLKDWEKLPSVTTVCEEPTEEIVKETTIEEPATKVPTNRNKTERISTSTKEMIHSKSQQIRLPSHPNIPTNDGTHRITIKWKTMERNKDYENDKSKLNEAIHKLVGDMFPEEFGVLYRWESEDLVMSNTANKMSNSEIRDFISPKITFVSASNQIIFGIRFGFTKTPSSWRNSETMKAMFESHQLEVSISNSTSTSGNMVTAGYILLKAPNTTHLLRYTKYLRSLLPDTAPYFDIHRYKKSPMDQLTPHLTIECGEKHVTPLCQALLPVLTGRGKALFLPRYAFSTMNNAKVRQHFQFHDKWAKSLKAITLSPMINHLDQLRIEYNEDGSTTERSAREWVSTLMEKDGTTPALCDVVNGSKDQKSYLVSPSHFLHEAQHQWNLYKSRLHPPSHREARFRDNLPGLPNVITIQKEIQSNVSFLEQMSMTEIWKQDTAYPSQETQRPSQSSDQPNDSSNRTTQETRGREVWPALPERYRHRPVNSTQTENDRSDIDSTSNSGRTSQSGIEEERSTTSTKSMTHGSGNNITNRFQELEYLLKRQHKEMEVSGKKYSVRLSQLERQFDRIEEIDSRMSAFHLNLESANQKMEQTSKHQTKISNELHELKTDTSAQLSDMKNKTLSTMESQHTMSTTMLEMREQIEQLSKFMIELASKLEIAMNRGATEAGSPTSGTELQSRAIKRSQNNSSTNSFSSKSRMSHDSSSQDSSVYRSPEKKKQRPKAQSRHNNIESPNTRPQKLGTQTIGSQEKNDEKSIPHIQAHHQLGYDHEYDQMSEDSSDLCLNLEDAFDRTSPEEEHQRPLSQTKTPKSSNTKPPVQLGLNITESAPLDPQYTKATDLAGAYKT